MIKVIWGSNKEKPVASRQLADALTENEELDGYLYVGYPIIGAPTGPMKFDALLLSEQKGIIAFDLVEGLDLGNYQERQDEIASMLDVKFKPYPALKHGRHLKFDIKTVTFIPSKHNNLPASTDIYNVCNLENFNEHIDKSEWECDSDTFRSLLAAIQVVTSIRANRSKRSIAQDNSLGARLKKLEDSIANLDQHQSEAVIETVDGVQRIRGLAGSGKTIVLALKVAYLHAQNPDWKIAVTFHSRALKEQLRRLINNFTIEQIGTEPDWDCIDIVNSWGGPGNKDNDGIYHMFCAENSLDFIDFGTAKKMFGNQNAFAGVCQNALDSLKSECETKYNVILVDEAQDFPADFLRLCYAFLKEPKRLVYAYDELQSLNGQSVLPPDELFGKNDDGTHRVVFINDDPTKPKQDIILEKCYRNSRPLLATAHALGFGLKRQQGLVQFFDNDALWEEVGYSLKEGELVGGENVSLARTVETSPAFLEEHSPIEELIKFHSVSSKQEMDDCLVHDIEVNISEDELRPEDIVVINPDPISTKNKVAEARAMLLRKGISSELAGVTTSRDSFSKSGAVTFTGIFRAKGNEAGMVYIINAQDCFNSYDQNQLALVRNQLFTAITRSKAWVRIYGIGPNMDALKREWESLIADNYALKFKYPTDAEKTQLKLINRDMTVQERTKQIRLTRNLHEILQALSAGELDPDLVPQDMLDLIKKLKK